MPNYLQFTRWITRDGEVAFVKPHPLPNVIKQVRKNAHLPNRLRPPLGVGTYTQKGCLSFSLSYDLHVLSAKILVLKYQGGSVHLDV